MNTKQLLMIGISMLASAAAGPAAGQEKLEQYIQVADIEIHPSQIDAYRAAVKEQIETAVRVEPGVLTLCAVSDKDDPAKVKVFEIYRDDEAHRQHLESEHFKRYKATTQSMVRSLKLIRTDAIALGANVRGGAR